MQYSPAVAQAVKLGSKPTLASVALPGRNTPKQRTQIGVELSQTNLRSGIRITVRVLPLNALIGTIAPYPSSTASSVTVYRMLLPEAIENDLRHGNASTLDLSFKVEQSQPQDIPAGDQPVVILRSLTARSIEVE